MYYPDYHASPLTGRGGSSSSISGDSTSKGEIADGGSPPQSTPQSPIEGWSIDDVNTPQSGEGQPGISCEYEATSCGGSAPGQHRGVDWSLGIGNEGYVNPILGGTVVSSDANIQYPYGVSMVVETPAAQLSFAMQQALGIQNGQSVYILYAHIRQWAPPGWTGEFPDPITIGTDVNPGERIGMVGNTGTDLAHLHVEVQIGPTGLDFGSLAKSSEGYRLWFDPIELQRINPLDLYGLEYPASGS